MILSPDNSITIYRGASKTVQLTVLQDDATTPVDLSNARAVLTVKKDIGDAQPIFQKSTDIIQQALITNAKGGVVQFFLVPADTAKLDVRPYVFDVWVQLANGARYPAIVPAVFDVQAGVTIMS
jgi:hypothetical protein